MPDATDSSVGADLIKVRQEAIDAAYTSWIETDKLHVSVCSALIALATLFGHSPTLPVFLVGALALLLSINWAWLITRYRWKIVSELTSLAQEPGDPRISEYYQAEQTRFQHDSRYDYLIVGIVGFASSVLILFEIAAPSLPSS